MNNISINISGRIDPERVSILRDIKAVADELDIKFFVVGAFARDINFELIHHIPAPRMTEDIDIGIEVADWETFLRLTDSLIVRDALKPTSTPHRFLANSSNIRVDIVPYGSIGDEMKKISWPPDHRIIMSILGFEEAFQSALQVCFETEPLLQILVPSVPALTLLKIISWDDGYPHRERDAHDILFILENYHLIVSENLYEPPAFLLEAEGFDLSVAAVRLLGREIAELCCTVTKEAIEIILERETDKNGEFRMLSQIGSAGSFRTDKFENSLQLMKKLLQGIREGSPGA